MTDRILEALGAKDELNALQLVSDANTFLTNVNEVTGRTTYDASLSVIKANTSLAREIESITGKTGGECLGLVLAWKVAHEKAPELSAEIADLKEKARAATVSSLIKQALSTEPPSEQNPHAGKLVPATAKFWETRDVETLEAFLAASPRVIPSAAKQPTVNLGATPLSNANGALVTPEGKTYEALQPAERAKLKRNDREYFNALHANWKERGEPALTSASAAH